MSIALEKLGYENVYHFSSVFENETHPDQWIAALEEKYKSEGRKSTEQFTKEYWDEILGEYHVSYFILSEITHPS